MNSLFSPLTFKRGPAMNNRFMLAPLTNLQSHEDGTCSEDEYHWLTKRAEGGFGLTMTCAAHVQPEGKGFPGQLGIFSDDHLPGLTRLAAGIKAHDSVAIVQLYHGGMRSPSEVYLTAEKPSILCRAVLSDSSFLYPLAAKEVGQLHVYVYQNTAYFTDASFSGEIQLYDAAGRCVFRYFATEVQTVELPLLAQAVYILRVQNAKGITVRPIKN
jgi:2,4-dienoyl-CoA reductase-like NADH-dependent reductase (Old Yellow Enzyme family)